MKVVILFFLVVSFHCYAQKQTGCILGNCKNGTGTMTFADGGKYSGKWKDGKQNGMGVYKFPDGSKYAGEWLNGKQNGQGVYLSAAGDKYIGQWKDGHRNGHGLMIWSTGEKYLGNWENDLRSGHGKVIWASGETYVGEWKDDQINGCGIMAFRNGKKGIGEWKDGVLAKEMAYNEFSKIPAPKAPVGLKTESILHQFTFGTGGGAASAYAGSRLVKTNFVWFLDAGYYPAPWVDVNIERQAGTLQGDALNLKNTKKFNNTYSAFILSVSVKPGYVFDYQLNGFSNFVKNFYLQTGYGILNNDVTNTNIIHPQITDHVKNTIGVIPVKAGYEVNLLSKYYEPLIKIDISYSFNYAIDKGLDGYLDNHIKHFYFYNLYAIGLKYAFSIRHNSR
ncbi:MAG: MORN repeat-containing protein [Bacteroidia bacterium]